MRINDNSNINRLQQLQAARFRGLDQFENSESDSLQFSDQIKDLQSALEALSRMPDVRQEEVDTLRHQLEEGTLDLSIDELADKIMGPSGNSDVP